MPSRVCVPVQPYVKYSSCPRLHGVIALDNPNARDHLRASARAGARCLRVRRMPNRVDPSILPERVP